jgi:hypothetical protein
MQAEKDRVNGNQKIAPGGACSYCEAQGTASHGEDMGHTSGNNRLAKLIDDSAQGQDIKGENHLHFTPVVPVQTHGPGCAL